MKPDYAPQKTLTIIIILLIAAILTIAINNITNTKANNTIGTTLIVTDINGNTDTVNVIDYTFSTKNFTLSNGDLLPDIIDKHNAKTYYLPK